MCFSLTHMYKKILFFIFILIFIKILFTTHKYIIIYTRIIIHTGIIRVYIRVIYRDIYAYQTISYEYMMYQYDTYHMDISYEIFLSSYTYEYSVQWTIIWYFIILIFCIFIVMQRTKHLLNFQRLVQFEQWIQL